MSFEKKYQVFVSSTFEDLEPERAAIFKALMKGDFIPAGMEIWPADTRPPLDVIAAEMERSDFYVVIIAGRYGDVDENGVSYTELEYGMAKDRGMPILAFLHKSPGDIPAKYTDPQAKKKRALEKFRKRLARHTIDRWTNADNLSSVLLPALQNERTRTRAIGWVRGDKIASVDALTELVRLQRENSELRAAIEETGPLLPDIAELDETFYVQGTYLVPNGPPVPWGKEYTWANLFSRIARQLQVFPSEEMVESWLVGRLLGDATGLTYGDAVLGAEFDDGVWRQIGIQLRALKLIQQLFRQESEWHLTPQGEELYLASLAIKTKKKPATGGDAT